MACMWCMKAQVVKRTSVAFFRWKYGVSRSSGFGFSDSLSASQFSSPARSRAASTTPRLSAVLAHAISVANHVKEHEVESELNFSPGGGTDSHIFRSPSASVQAANAAATTVLQHDLHTMPPPVGSGAWQERRRAGSFTSLSGLSGLGGGLSVGGVGGGNGGAGAGAGYESSASGEFKFQLHEEGEPAHLNERGAV